MIDGGSDLVILTKIDIQIKLILKYRPEFPNIKWLYYKLSKSPLRHSVI